VLDRVHALPRLRVRDRLLLAVGRCLGAVCAVDDIVPASDRRLEDFYQFFPVAIEVARDLFPRLPKPKQDTDQVHALSVREVLELREAQEAIRDVQGRVFVREEAHDLVDVEDEVLAVLLDARIRWKEVPPAQLDDLG
jgi:hypothetical protein